jgi:hypothetical protein
MGQSWHQQRDLCQTLKNITYCASSLFSSKQEMLGFLVITSKLMRL